MDLLKKLDDMLYILKISFPLLEFKEGRTSSEIRGQTVRPDKSGLTDCILEHP